MNFFKQIGKKIYNEEEAYENEERSSKVYRPTATPFRFNSPKSPAFSNSNAPQSPAFSNSEPFSNSNESCIAADLRECIKPIFIGKESTKPELARLCSVLVLENIEKVFEMLNFNEERKQKVLEFYERNRNDIIETLENGNLNGKSFFTVNDLKTIIVKKMSECNGYKYFTRELFLELYNNSGLRTCKDNADRDADECLRNFFSNENAFNNITDAIKLEAKKNIEKVRQTVNETITKQLDEKVATLRDLITKEELFYSTIIEEINIGLQNINPDATIFEFTKYSCNKKPYAILMLYMYYIAASIDIKVEIQQKAIDNLTPFNLGDMENTFATEIPASLDARQFITVNKFTKYRQQCDKACFLFHGVGTGKTITSTTIALSHLSEQNKFLKNGNNAGKQPLKVLAICPQGLFFSSFGGDAAVLGMYVCNKTVYSLPGEEYMDNNETKQKYNYTFEYFEAFVRCNNDDNSYYKIAFTGFNYLELFKYKGLEQITQQYDFLICDEAHKIITEKLNPESKQGYDINYKQGALGNTFGEMLYEPPLLGSNATPEVIKTYNENLQKYSNVTAIRDVRFVEFIKTKIIKQSVFLTGTPIQKTPYDVVSILKFLNIKEINESNNKKLCKDVNKDAPYNSNYYFNKLNRTSDPVKNKLVKGAIAELYLICQNLTGATVPDLDDELNKDNKEFDWIKFFGTIIGKDKMEQIREGVAQIKDEGVIISQQINDLQNLIDSFITNQNAVRSIVNDPNLGNLNNQLQALKQNNTELNDQLDHLKNNLKNTTEETLKTVSNTAINSIENTQKLLNNSINSISTVAKTQIPSKLDDISNQTNQLVVVIKKLKDEEIIIKTRKTPNNKRDSNSKGSVSNSKKSGGGNNEIIKYVNELQEQSLAIKQEINAVMSRFNNSELINTEPIINAIVKDTGISEDNINKMLQFLYDCLNGKNPYEVSLKVLGNEKVSSMLSPILGSNWVFLKNPASFDISIDNNKISFGGKKRIKTIKKKYLKRNKTHKKKYLGGEGELITYSNSSEQLVMQNINNDILVKEMPILLELYLYNFGLTLETQSNFFIKKTFDVIFSKNTTDLISDIETIKYTEKLLTNFYQIEFLNYDFDESGPIIEEIVEEQTAGASPTIGQIISSFVKSTISNIVKLFQQGDGSPMDPKVLLYMIVARVIPFIVVLAVGYLPSIPLPDFFKTPEFLTTLKGYLSSYTPAALEKAILFVSTAIAAAMSPIGKFATTPVGKNILTFFGKELLNFTWFLVKIILNIISYVINNFICGEFNLDGIIENLSPFISIYNYDYINTAIDNKQFYTELVSSNPKYALNQNVNKNGTTNAFPEKYIENIYYPFTQKQVRTLNSYSNGMLSKLFTLGSIDLTKESNIILLNKLNSDLNKISCGIDINKSYEKTYYKQQYLNYVNTNLKNKSQEYINSDSYNNRWQTGGVYISIDELKTQENNLFKNFKDKPRLPINVSGNFIDFSKEIFKENIDYEESLDEGLPFLFSPQWEKIITKDTIQNEYFDALCEKIKNTASTIPASIQFLQPKPYDLQLYKNNEKSKFENVLELLKIIRTGVIFQGENTEILKTQDTTIEKYTQFTYHPHYALNGIRTGTDKINTDENTQVEYYLPLIYPPTDDVMFGFCEFLNQKGYKYIWLNKYFDPFDLEAQVNFGVRFTFPIKPFDAEPGNEPICIIISENHKEGFSFIYNPALISLGLAETAGDEEQIYGRILRKYGKDALNGKYEKKIYQYFSGGNKNTQTLPTLTSLYSLDNKTVFRGMYDSLGFSKTTANGSVLGAVGDSIWLSIYLALDGMSFNSWVTTEQSREMLVNLNTIKTNDMQQNELNKQEWYDEYFPMLDLTDELQLKLLYSVKSVCLQFFTEIAKKENATPKISFGKRINPYYWFTPSPEPDFYPIDVQEMLKSSVSPKLYCIENLKDINQLYIKDKNGNEVLNLVSALVCSNKGVECPVIGGNKRKKTKSKRYARKTANKSIKKYKNKYNK